MKNSFKRAIIDLRFACYLIASVKRRADLVKTNLTLVVPVHQWCLPCWVSLQELVSDISRWEFAVLGLSPWQLARRACQDPAVPECKSHRRELQNCTHQPKLEKTITMKSWKWMNVPASLNCYIFICLFLPLSFLLLCFSSLLTSEECCLIAMQALYSIVITIKQLRNITPILKFQTYLDGLMFIVRFRCTVYHSTRTNWHGMLQNISRAIIWHFASPLVSLPPQ